MVCVWVNIDRSSLSYIILSHLGSRPTRELRKQSIGPGSGPSGRSARRFLRHRTYIKATEGGHLICSHFFNIIHSESPTLFLPHNRLFPLILSRDSISQSSNCRPLIEFQKCSFFDNQTNGRCVNVIFCSIQTCRYQFSYGQNHSGSWLRPDWANADGGCHAANRLIVTLDSDIRELPSQK